MLSLSAAASRCSASDIPDRYEFKKLYSDGGDDAWVNVGNSAIVDPDGYIIAGPVVEKQTILYAEIEPRKPREPKFWFDAAGHYARPDVFQLTVNRDANPMLNAMGATNGVKAGDGRRPAGAAAVERRRQNDQTSRQRQRFRDRYDHR